MASRKNIDQAKRMLRKLKYREPLTLRELRLYKEAGYLKVGKNKIERTAKANRQIKLIEEIYGTIKRRKK